MDKWTCSGKILLFVESFVILFASLRVSYPDTHDPELIMFLGVNSNWISFFSYPLSFLSFFFFVFFPSSSSSCSSSNFFHSLTFFQFLNHLIFHSFLTNVSSNLDHFSLAQQIHCESTVRVVPTFLIFGLEFYWSKFFM